MMCHFVLTGLTSPTSSIQRDVIQAQGQSGSNQKSAVCCFATLGPTAWSARLFPFSCCADDPALCVTQPGREPAGSLSLVARTVIPAELSSAWMHDGWWVWRDAIPASDVHAAEKCALQALPERG